MKVQTLIYVILLVEIAWCAENSVSINVKNAVNIISDRFISYEIEFCDLMNLYHEQNSLKNLSVISPAFVKLRGFSSYLKNTENKKFKESEVADLMENFISRGIIPVIVIDYNSETFEPINLLQELKAAQNLKIKSCVFQLGENELNLEDNKNLKRYNDDLKTLKILCEGVKREQYLNWDVAAVGSALKSHIEKIPFDVVGYNLKTLATDEILSRNIQSFPETHVPLWVNIENSFTESTELKESFKARNTCNHECLINGLLYAEVLFGSARKGLDVLFFDEILNGSSLSTSNIDFKTAVTILHKKLIGSKAFNVRVTKSSHDGKLSSLFSHCSKKNEGALILVGINFANMRSKFNVKTSTPIDSNVMILQYLLSGSDGAVKLNNEKFNANATPSYKYKKISKFSISLVLPPFSMAFWTLKNVKVDECLNLNDENRRNALKDTQLTSTDKLLKKLVANEFDGKKSNVIEKSRSKRQIGDGISGQFLPSAFDIGLPTLKFPSLMLSSSSNHKPIRDVLFSKNTDVFKTASTDVSPLPQSKNPLPMGDVYMTVDDGTPNVDESLRVVVDDEPKRYRENRKKANSKAVYRETTEETPEFFIPHDYLDASEKKTKPRKSSKKVEQLREIGELFEVERSNVALTRGGDQTRSPSQNVELKTVIRELEPTYRQSKIALKAAKKKWDRSQIMELLKDAQLNDNERSHLAEADDFEVIDLTENEDENPNYAEYEEDDDGFFDSDVHHNVRTKRDLDYTRNEIPKYGFHDMVDEDEEESIESLMNDVRLYVPQISRDSNSDLTQTNAPIAPSNPPITVKAINFFSKSLNHAVDVLDKTLVGWWYVFNPKTSNSEQ